MIGDETKLEDTIFRYLLISTRPKWLAEMAASKPVVQSTRYTMNSGFNLFLGQLWISIEWHLLCHFAVSFFPLKGPLTGLQQWFSPSNRAPNLKQLHDCKQNRIPRAEGRNMLLIVSFFIVYKVSFYPSVGSFYLILLRTRVPVSAIYPYTS